MTKESSEEEYKEYEYTAFMFWAQRRVAVGRGRDEEVADARETVWFSCSWTSLAGWPARSRLWLLYCTALNQLN